VSSESLHEDISRLAAATVDRRRDYVFEAHLKSYLFTSGPIKDET